jgi:hypothetical protein
MALILKEWQDLPAKTTPIDAESLNDLERRTTAQRGTSMPASAEDGAEYDWVANEAAGVIWRFRYHTGSVSAYKWEFVGGSELLTRVVAAETTATTGWVDLATLGPDVTVPRAGDYFIRYGAAVLGNVAGQMYHAGIAQGAGATPAGALLQIQVPTTGAMLSLATQDVFTGVAANTLLRMRYFVPAAGTSAQFGERWLAVYPRRVA